MEIKQRILELYYQDRNERIEIDNLLLTIITKYQLFEPCRYLSEDDQWLNVSMLSIEDENITQPMSIRKSEIVMFAIFNREEIENIAPNTEPEEFYQ